MKRVLTILLCAGCVLTAAAALKPVTVLVMDSTNALIDGASFFAGGQRLCTTSWDGRGQIALSDETAIEVIAPGRDTLNISLNPDQSGQTLIVKMSGRRLSEYESADSGIFVRGIAGAAPAVCEEAVADVVYYSKASGSKSAAKTTRSSKRADRTTATASDMVVWGEVPMPEVSYIAEADEAAMEEVVATGYGAFSKGSYAGSASNALPSAGKLTAGEVNDFAKWALWAKVIDQSHKEYVKDWHMEARERYVLQLTNKQGFPLADRSVSLMDKHGNTLYQARTDNTGRAELWNGLCGKAAAGKLYISAEGQRIPAKPFSEGINMIELDEACSVPDVADVFFVFDATGSMGDELRYLQAEMQDVIRRSQSAVEGLKIRTGALVYRDHTDQYVTRISRLSDDIQTAQQFIQEQHAMGGGDYEEAIPEALMAACNAAGWSEEARARIAFLVLDAPCHQDSATLRLLHEQTLNAAAQGIRIVPVVCSGLRESGELLMRSLALATNGTSFFLTDDSGIGHSHLKPTTDSLKVEHLNDMLVRTIISFTRMPECSIEQWAEEALEYEETDRFLPAPFTADDLDTVPQLLPQQWIGEILLVRPNPCTDFCLADLPKGCDALFLCDLTGKTIESLGSQPENTAGLQIRVSSLSSGVYFVKAFYGGRWYTQKLIVR